tara:strand:- start:876 stop:1109 length:234 start_codon:yes stop_codon:yes gene_type:complete
MIEFAIPKPIAKWIFPPGVSYERTCLTNSSECFTNISTLDVLGTSISVIVFSEQEYIKKIKNKDAINFSKIKTFTKS